jgi:outer membrane protein assembly factor BamB
VRRFGRLAAIAACLALVGCGLGWLGENEDAPLPGQRKAVLLLEEGITADPALGTVPITLPSPRRNEAWPQAGGNATHAMQHLALAETVREAWQADIGRGAGRRTRLLAPPIVAGGRIYTLDSAGEARAFATADGQEIWRRRSPELATGDRLATGGLAAEGGRLIVTGAGGAVVALDLASGAELWKTDIRAPIRSAPTVTEGRALVVTADNQLFALDAGNGRTQWRQAGVFEQAGILGGASPAATGGIVISAYSSGEVFALDLVSGRPLWSDTVLRPRRTLAIGQISDIIGDPVIDRELVLVAGASGEMVALDLVRGDRIWEAGVTSTQMPWAAGDYVYLLTERSELVALTRADGRIRWVTALATLRDPEDPDSGRIRWVGPVLAGGRLIVASSNGDAASLSPLTGRVLGSQRLGDPVSLPPIVADGTLYFLTDAGTLLAYR